MKSNYKITNKTQKTKNMISNFIINSPTLVLINTKFSFTRPFSCSSILCADRNQRNNNVNPNATIYGDSESSFYLANRFSSTPKDLMKHQEKKLDETVEKSERYITEVCRDRARQRRDLPTQDLEKFDQETRELVEEEHTMCDADLDEIAGVRDDALDYNSEVASTPPSNIGSDPESVESLEERLQNVNAVDELRKQRHAEFVSRALERIGRQDENSVISDDSSDDSSDELGSGDEGYSSTDNPISSENVSQAETNSSAPNSSDVESTYSEQSSSDVESTDSEQNSSNVELTERANNVQPTVSEQSANDVQPTVNEQSSSNKRKHENLDDETSNKRIKHDESRVQSESSTANNSNNSKDNIPGNSESPIDYILAKQQSEPYDPFDDLD